MPEDMTLLNCGGRGGIGSKNLEDGKEREYKRVFAAGKALWRMVEKHAQIQERAGAKELFGDIQYGVGTPTGIETFTHMLRTCVSLFDGKHTKVVDNRTTIRGHISSFTACLTEQAPLEAVLATTVGVKAVKAFIDNIAVVLELDTLEAPHVQEDQIGATFVNFNAQLNTVGLEVMKRDDNIIYINDTMDWTMNFSSSWCVMSTSGGSGSTSAGSDWTISMHFGSWI
jgi:hypothetical protein